MKFHDWLEKQDVDYYGLCPPPMEAQTAIDILCCYLLGEDWYTPLPLGAPQVNTEIVVDILNRYSKKFNKEKKKYVQSKRKGKAGL